MTPKSTSRFRRGPFLVALAAMAIGFALGWQMRDVMMQRACADAGGVWVAQRSMCGVAQ